METWELEPLPILSAGICPVSTLRSNRHHNTGFDRTGPAITVATATEYLVTLEVGGWRAENK